MDQEEVYVEFLNYDWTQVKDFEAGVNEILQNYEENLQELQPGAKMLVGDRQQLIDQAKVFYFCSNTDHILELEEYRAWEREWGDRYRKNPKIEEIEVSEDNDKNNKEGDAPYSNNYQELVELIMLGKDVPGIKHIPETVLSEKKSSSSAEQRKKPWET